MWLNVTYLHVNGWKTASTNTQKTEETFVQPSDSQVQQRDRAEHSLQAPETPQTAQETAAPAFGEGKPLRNPLNLRFYPHCCRLTG